MGLLRCKVAWFLASPLLVCKSLFSSTVISHLSTKFPASKFVAVSPSLFPPVLVGLCLLKKNFPYWHFYGILGGWPCMPLTAIPTPIAKIWKQPNCPSTDDWIKKMCYVYTMEYYSAIKEWNNAICSNTDGPAGYYAKWNKSDRERQILYVSTYMRNL